MILVLSGTTDGREAAAHLRRAGHKVLISAATDFFDPSARGEMRSRQGPLDRGSLSGLLKTHKVRAVVDATHPFAQRITALAKDVCADQGVPYFRFERGAAAVPKEGRIERAATTAAASRRAAGVGKRIFLATGVKTLGDFVTEGRRHSDDIEFFARILPWNKSLSETLKWLPAQNIIAAVGPFSVDFNLACFKRFEVDTLVTKNSGAGAGVEEKISAAVALDLNVIVIERPRSVGPVVTDIHALAAALDVDWSRSKRRGQADG